MRRQGIKTIVDLVERSHVSRNTIYGWTAGKRTPQFAQLNDVAAALDVPMAYLVDAWDGNLWPDPQTREPLPNAESIEARALEIVQATLDRIEASRRAPDTGSAQ